MNAYAATILIALAAVASCAMGASIDRIDDLIAEAEEGAVVHVPPGVYTGNLRVSKPVVLEGGGAAIIDGEGEGTVVELQCADITFRGFTIRGSAAGVDREPAGIRALAGPVVIESNQLQDVLFGIDLRSSPDSIVRGNSIVGKDMEPGRRGDGIRLWWSHGCVVEDNTVRSARDMVFWYSEDLRIRRNNVERCRYGLHFMYSHKTELVENKLVGNSVGIYLMYSNDIVLRRNELSDNRGPSGYGIGLKDCDNIVVTGNRVHANRVGIYIDNAPSSVDATARFDENAIAYNEIGVLLTPNTRGDVIVRNGFIENEEQVGIHGPGDLEGNSFSSGGIGNFWSDYPGFDLDADGVGDLAFEPRSLFESLIGRHPNLRMFMHSPAQHAVDFAARALPQVQPVPKFVDSAPLMAPPDIAPLPVDFGARRVMGAIALGLLLSAGMVMVLGARDGALRAPRVVRQNTTRGGCTP